MRIELASGTPAEIVRPSGDPTMGLVIAPDIFGLRPLFDDLVARWAEEWQMVVCAAEPFPGRDLGDDMAARFDAVPRLDDAAQLRDLLEAADATGCDRVGLMGFCMGGMYAFKAAQCDRFAAIASFYGMIRLPEAWRGEGQREPLEILSEGNADRVLAILGEKDPYTPPADVEALGTTGAVCVVYPDAEHGFAHDVARPAHRADDATDAFTRARDWLSGHAG